MKLTQAQRALLAEQRKALSEYMPEGTYALYTLSDPDTGAVRYVGITQRPRSRLLHHLKHPVLHGEKQRWLEQLASRDRIPLMTIVETFYGTSEEALQHERKWIRRLTGEGAALLNHETRRYIVKASRDDISDDLYHEFSHGRSDEAEDEEILLPVEQFFVPLFGKSILCVRLADGRQCVALRWICDCLRLDQSAQTERIKRKSALRDGLLRARIQTNGGPQVVPVLDLDMVPGWILSIDEHRVAPEMREQVIALQRETVRVLFEKSGLAAWQKSKSEVS